MNFRIYSLLLLICLQSCDLKTSAEYNAEAEILEEEEKFEEAIVQLLYARHDLGYLEEGCADLLQTQELGDPNAPTVLKQYCK
ncbi:hypothetical protein [Croceimicrobium hydrocarbonivorans]|uniref:Uncharacterized protein n=1 Tax=Croceimicrobium hydrocarbonivorans TaxID=2761580 RepID=A0A7H0VDW1_9FLAO|nr:hypothetical protein [Croceimicrobium hydrocarbonivorans]QNR23909.1 hypothetical protein H4K34_16255 [Croceimicrobium hydrocarbonivorans]